MASILVRLGGQKQHPTILNTDLVSLLTVNADGSGTVHLVHGAFRSVPKDQVIEIAAEMMDTVPDIASARLGDMITDCFGSPESGTTPPHDPDADGTPESAPEGTAATIQS